MERTDRSEREGVTAFLARQKSSASLRMQSDLGSTASDRKPREEKSAPYKSAKYEIWLNSLSIFMEEDEDGPDEDSRALCQRLMETPQLEPQDSIFTDDLFKATCRRLRTANEAKVIDKIARLIVPSAEELADRGSDHLEHLVESINEGWNNCEPLARPRPQPDFSLGFSRSAFSKQLAKLQPFVGGPEDTSLFVANYSMWFPIFTCEVKCGTAALDIADRQNAHSMFLAVRGMVDAFKLVKLEHELDRRILAFSMSHDHRSVRIHGHYPRIRNKETAFYRCLIHAFDFTALDGKERWTPRRFVTNLYHLWTPMVLQMLHSAIDQIPHPSSERVEEPELQEESGCFNDSCSAQYKVSY